MRSACMRLTESAALTPQPSCIARNQVDRRFDALRNPAKGCAVNTRRTAAAPALQRGFTARPSPGPAVLQQAGAAASAGQQQATMAAVDEGDLVTPELAWRQFPGSEHYSDKCAHSWQPGCSTRGLYRRSPLVPLMSIRRHMVTFSLL